MTAPLLSPHPLRVEDGCLEMLATGASAAAHEMRYRATLVSREGRRFSLTGHKELTQSGGLDVWADTTTLFVTLREGEDTFAKGTVHIEPSDFLRQLTTWRAKRSSPVVGAVTTVARVGSFLGRNIAQGSLEATRGSTPPSRPTTDVVASSQRPRSLPAPEEHTLHAGDGALLRLQRFASAGAPVVLSHCVGVSSAIFAAPGVEPSLALHLAARGYDVWLLDLRTSSALDASKRPYDLDDVARHDYPAALDYVVRSTGHPAAHVVAHGIGGVTLLMSLLGGHSEGRVRSAVCMQSALHFRPTSQRLLKTSSSLSDFVSRSARASAGDGAPRSLARAALSLYPRAGAGPCADPLCRARTLALGPLVGHDRVTPAAHDALLGMLATPGARFLAHMDRLGRTGCVVDASGGDVYMPHVDRLHLPLTFVRGEGSAWFAPTAGATTHRLLSGAPHARCEEHVLEGRAHFDLLLAQGAAEESFAIIDRHLDRWSAAPALLSRAG